MFFLKILKFALKNILKINKIKFYSIKNINFNKDHKTLVKKQNISIIKPNFLSKPTDKIQYKIHKHFPDIKIKIIHDVKVFGQSNFIFKNNEVYYSNDLWDPKNNFCLEEISGKCLI